MSDEITLRLPREREFYGVAHLVVGGLAVRLNLTFDHLEDLQIALAGLLEREGDGGDVTVAIRLDGDVVAAAVGPFGESLKGELERESAGGVGLRRVLETVADGFALTDREGGRWVELTKRVATETAD